ncbi:MAG: sulfur carrier protein ThiS [Caulobacterales bacterium]
MSLTSLSEGYAPMRIIVNGDAREVKAATIADLLTILEAPQKGLAVERNRAIVPKSLYKSTLILDGDEIEIVQFVGGG